MTKEEHIKYWIEQSDDDWKTVDTLYNSKRFLHSLFFTHLVLEKLCKAIWIKNNEGNYPPKIHNLVYLLSQTEVKPDNEQLDLLLLFNTFQLEGRYPDYQKNIANKLNEKITKKYIDSAIKLKIWLHNNLL